MILYDKDSDDGLSDVGFAVRISFDGKEFYKGSRHGIEIEVERLLNPPVQSQKRVPTNRRQKKNR